jgi:hypothetical protein
MTLALKKTYAYAKKTPVIIAGKWASKIEVWPVQLLALSGVWATVRRKGAMPFVVLAKELSEATK